MIEMLYFTASWCNPCRVVKPLVQQLQNEGHNITIIDSDQNPDLAREYRIMAVPTFVVKKNGQIVRRHSGVLGKPALLAMMNV